MDGSTFAAPFAADADFVTIRGEHLRGYGLGRSGWVTARFPRTTRLPVDILGMWIDESYRALAPKRLLTQLENTPPSRAQRSSRTEKKPARRR
jgi:hypothetical protein